jgi:hypothetical protein
MRTFLFCLIATLSIPGVALADDVVIENVEVTKSSAGGYSFSVTLRHGDTGLDHYADKWEVLSMDGKVSFGERVLFHPHINEQLFTRSLRSVVDSIAKCNGFKQT